MAYKSKKIASEGKGSGFEKKYSDSEFLKALDATIPRPTAQIRKAVGCSHDTASRTLKDISKKGLVEMIEIEAGTGTGKMYLWTLTDEGKKKVEEMKKDEQEN